MGRAPGCHAVCEKYRKFRTDRDKLLAERQRQNALYKPRNYWHPSRREK